MLLDAVVRLAAHFLAVALLQLDRHAVFVAEYATYTDDYSPEKSATQKAELQRWKRATYRRLEWRY